MGPYCNFCDQRCFVERTLPDDAKANAGDTILMATCNLGKQTDRLATGYDSSTAINPHDGPKEWLAERVEKAALAAGDAQAAFDDAAKTLLAIVPFAEFSEVSRKVNGYYLHYPNSDSDIVSVELIRTPNKVGERSVSFCWTDGYSGELATFVVPLSFIENPEQWERDAVAERDAREQENHAQRKEQERKYWKRTLEQISRDYPELIEEVLG